MLCPQNMSVGPRLPESMVWHVLRREKGNMLLLLMMMMMDDDEGCWMMVMVMAMVMAVAMVKAMMLMVLDEGVHRVCRSLWRGCRQLIS